MLNAHDRERYGRQMLLTEVGDSGQQRLLASTISACADAAPAVEQTAFDYLTRAGVVDGRRPRTSAASGAFERPVQLPDRDGVTALTGGADHLTEAASALLGAYAAVETLKTILDVGTQAHLPTDFALSQET